MSKCRHKQRNMATILVSNSSVTSLISDFFLIYIPVTALVSFFEIKHFENIQLWNILKMAYC